MTRKHRFGTRKPRRWPWLAALAALSALSLLNAPAARAQTTEPELPTACGMDSSRAVEAFSLTSTTNSITVTFNRPGTQATIALCGPFGTEGAYIRRNVKRLDVASGTAYTITHDNNDNTGTELTADTDYWVQSNSYNFDSTLEYVKTKSSDEAAPTFSSAQVRRDKLTITFNEALAAAANLSNDAFEVKKTRRVARRPTWTCTRRRGRRSAAARWC